MKIKTLLTLLITGIFFHIGKANNISIDGNPTLSQRNTSNKTMYVNFDISWENSWRTSSAPNNWDAAWVFVKYKVGSSGEWKHAKLSSNSSSHSVENNNGVPCNIVAVPDSMGVFLQRSTDGTGNINWDGVKLLWKFGSDTNVLNDFVQIKVFALEMVYIPEGSFYLGDSTLFKDYGGFNRFYRASDTADKAKPFRITSELGFALGGTGDTALNSDHTDSPIPEYNYPDDDFDIDSTTIKLLPESYPKGFQDFYIMKYELTQQSWVDFLNTLARAQQNQTVASDITGTTVTSRFVMTNTAIPYVRPIDYGVPNDPIMVESRNGVACDATIPASDPVIFYCDLNTNGIPNEADDGQNIPINYISYFNTASYLDWSGLRPMSELELVKASRGTAYPVPDEFAWGTSTYQTPLSPVGDEALESEYNTYLTANTNFCPYHGDAGDTAYMPLRVGIFATPTSDRVSSGASYYGVMEMSSNMSELAVTIGNAYGRIYQGSHGNGYLNTNGRADVIDWHEFSLAQRIPGFVDYFLFSQVSTRMSANKTDIPTYRHIQYGIRGVRTAQF